MYGYMDFNGKIYNIGQQQDLDLNNRNLSFNISNDRKTVDLLNTPPGNSAQPRGEANKEAVMYAFNNFGKPNGDKILSAVSRNPQATTQDVEAALAKGYQDATSPERDKQLTELDANITRNKVAAIKEVQAENERLRREQFEYEKTRADRNDVIARNQYGDAQYERMIDKINANNQANSGFTGGTVMNGGMPIQAMPQPQPMFKQDPRESLYAQRENVDRQFAMQDRLIQQERERQQMDYQRGVDEASRVSARQQLGIQQGMEQQIFAQQQNQSRRSFEQDIQGKAIQNKLSKGMVSPTITAAKLDNAAKRQALQGGRMDLERRRRNGF